MKKRILVVDDEPDVCKSLAFRLETAGFEVSVAFDGQEGLRKAREEKPDVMLLDLMLPMISGEEVCKALRSDRDEKLRTLPIIVLTAQFLPAETIIKNCGATAYLTKPYDFELLLEGLKKY